jgi:hypothetical protein
VSKVDPAGVVFIAALGFMCGLCFAVEHPDFSHGRSVGDLAGEAVSSAVVVDPDPRTLTMAGLLATYRVLADRRGELARERPGATAEDAELRRHQLDLVRMMREEAGRAPTEVGPEVESILAEEP